MRTRQVVLSTLLLVNTAVYGADSEGFHCLLEPSRVVQIASQQPGIVKRVYVDRGDQVKPGQKLVLLKNAVELAMLGQAKARLEFARRRARRNDDLSRKNLLSPHERDEMQTEVAMAEQELSERRARLALRSISSPVAGIVIKRDRSPGEYVGEDPILTIVSVDPLYVEITAPVSAIGRIHEGMQAEIRTQEIDGVWPATVTVVDPVVDATSNTFGIRLTLANPDHQLLAGLNCMVKFIEDNGASEGEAN